MQVESMADHCASDLVTGALQHPVIHEGNLEELLPEQVATVTIALQPRTDARICPLHLLVLSIETNFEIDIHYETLPCLPLQLKSTITAEMSSQ